MSYTTQLLTESVKGKHNILSWVYDEIASIKSSDIELVLARAELFLTMERSDLASKARVEEIAMYYGLEDAKVLLVNSLLAAIILIKPTLVIRGGKEVAYAGVAPIQAVATQIGLALHHDQIDAVQTGIELLAHFNDLGIYTVRIVREEDRTVNQGHITVHGDSAVIVPTMSVSLSLYKRIKFTQYLPPMLVQPLSFAPRRK